jgi:hypothetical protein
MDLCGEMMEEEDLVQLQNPRSQKWVVVDRAKGIILEERHDEPVPGVPIAGDSSEKQGLDGRNQRQ